MAASRVRFTIRSDRRFPVSCPVYYMGRALLGRGTAVNLSTKGWRVQGDEPVRSGQWLTFRLELVGHSQPIQFPRAIVRWTSGLEFGVEWLLADDTTQQGLQQYVCSMASRQ
ncbi:MAG: PilZ domain-containing protein [Nitrospiraceae bacterium]